VAKQLPLQAAGATLVGAPVLRSGGSLGVAFESRADL
jgi:hypothetical protein